MLYFLTTSYTHWDITDARQQLSQECGGMDLNRKLKVGLQAIIDGENFVKLAKKKAESLIKTIKFQKDNTEAGSSTPHEPFSITNNNYNNIGDNTTQIINNHTNAITQVKRSRDTISPATKKPTRKPRLEYLAEGEGPVVIDDTTNNWVVNGINLSEKLHDFRDKAILNVEQYDSPSNIYEELALNGIFLLDEPGRKQYKVSSSVFIAAKNEVSEQYPASTNAINITDQIKQISLIMKTDCEKAVDSASVWVTKAISSTKNDEKKVARSLSQVLGNLAQKKVSILREPLFCSQLVEPLVCPFLPQSSDVKLRGSSEESAGSRARRGREGRMPDLSLCTDIDGLNHALFLCEVKSLNYIMQENSHSDPDFIKLMNIMKDELDFTAGLDNKSRIVYSLLVQGDLCRMFAMDFMYHKTYRVIMLDQFHLPIDIHDVQRLDSCYGALLRLESLLISLIGEFTDYFYGSGPSTPVEGRLTTESLKSFSSPKKE
ncbi:uncharacterized protein EV154DRAFT_561227 [Mucor mucedo]|uniref:uncharacterized protein n=1 Tax=Mucor mucedo TaxID=29922 RepID=UPI00221FCE40|nr:uncharacterized protein EV154DRAFT_561227 [Mucor mucedo]KAI7893481.1 hypothetical protein EV154DRAFT_561227 [Mucor mucedo]